MTTKLATLKADAYSLGNLWQKWLTEGRVLVVEERSMDILVKREDGTLSPYNTAHERFPKSYLDIVEDTTPRPPTREESLELELLRLKAKHAPPLGDVDGNEAELRGWMYQQAARIANAQRALEDAQGRLDRHLAPKRDLEAFVEKLRAAGVEVPE